MWSVSGINTIYCLNLNVIHEYKIEFYVFQLMSLNIAYPKYINQICLTILLIFLPIGLFDQYLWIPMEKRSLIMRQL
jgi:hypothetical protein